MNACIIDQMEQKSKDFILKSDFFGKDCSYLVEPLKAGDLLLTWNDQKYCAELKIDKDWINSYLSNDWIEKIGNLIKESIVQNYIPIVLVTLSDEFLSTELTLTPKWNKEHDVCLWMKKFYDVRDRIQMKYPHVIFKICFDSFPKDKHISALEVGLKWMKDFMNGKEIEKKPIVFDHPILVRNKTKQPVLALASLCDGITEKTAFDILVKVGSWEKLCQLSQDQLLEICKDLKVAKYNFVSESIYVGLRLNITTIVERESHDEKND